MRKILLSVCVLFTFSCASQAEENGFKQWVETFKLEAAQAGISAQTLFALDSLTLNSRVVELDGKQPESTKTFTQYMVGVLPQSRIDKGKALLIKHGDMLERVEAKYGVQKRFIIALWGMETNYGGYTGNFSILRSLATLAYDGRRGEFFTKELLHALKIIDQGHITAAAMEGSWAGAMGQSQFMPSSFLAYAVDENGDGRKDIWGTQEDVFASIANYLSKSGWNKDLTWGRAVSIPADIDASLEDAKTYLSLQDWQTLGVRKADGSDLPDVDLQARLVFPGTQAEQTYLVYKNYDVLMKWNRSNYFGVSVGTLSDRIGY